MKAPKGGSVGRQDIDTTGTGTDLTALPQRDVAPRIIETQDSRLVLELKQIGVFTKLDTTPSVLNNEHWKAQNVVPVSITDFDQAQDGQHLYILGDGQTTIVDGTPIKTLTGSNLLLAVDIVYHFVSMFGTWYQV